MNPHDTHREQLSALIDGALDADRSRFLLRRLQHDGALVDDLSRWQLAGDALRGQATASAPDGFAEAIAMRIAAEPQPVIEGEGLSVLDADAKVVKQSSRPVARASRWGWFGGGALAASLAMAMVWSLRPATTPAGSEAASFASVEASSYPAPVTVATPSAANASTIQLATNDSASVAATASTAVVAASVARTPATRRSPAPTTRVAQASRAPIDATPAMPVREAAAMPRIEDSLVARSTPVEDEAASPRDPFQPPAARPWPRAAVPSNGGVTFNASLDRNAAFSPFAADLTQAARDDQ